jgi:excisionase family DNA binding protein
MSHALPRGLPAPRMTGREHLQDALRSIDSFIEQAFSIEQLTDVDGGLASRRTLIAARVSCLMSERQRTGSQNAPGNTHPPRPAKQQARRLLTVAEAAERLDLAQKTVRTWIAQRKLECVRVGRLVKIPETEVEGLIASNRTPAIK